MSTSTNTPSSYKLKKNKTSPCVDRECTSGRKNRYFVGKRLTPDTFQVEQDYLVERRRLLNRAIHGWGVVYGYSVSVKAADSYSGEATGGLLAIGAGLALDAVGRELVQTETLSLSWADVTVLDTNGKPVKDPLAIAAPTATKNDKGCTDRPPGEGCWLLRVHYTEESIGPVTLNDPCSCDRRQWDQVCETVRYSLTRIDCAKCCDEHPCELDCCCATSQCCQPPQTNGKHDSKAAEDWERTRKTPRGGCRCLCDHLTNLEVDVGCSALCPVEEGVRVDWHNGVPLACVSLRQNECMAWEFGSVIEDCGPRRLVKRNDLLFDLIRGCDLTHISAISWATWHRATSRVLFSDFEKFFGKEGPSGERITDFAVEFSRPVRKSTLAADCFSMTIVIPEDEGGWEQVLRAPIVGVEYCTKEGDPPEYVRGARLIVGAAWASDAVCGRKTQFHHHHATVEIEIRGDYILDCNGQPIDANAHGRVPSPTGNGTPGGTFLSTFRLHKKLHEGAGNTSAY